MGLPNLSLQRYGRTDRSPPPAVSYTGEGIALTVQQKYQYLFVLNFRFFSHKWYPAAKKNVRAMLIEKGIRNSDERGVAAVFPAKTKGIMPGVSPNNVDSMKWGYCTSVAPMNMLVRSAGGPGTNRIRKQLITLFPLKYSSIRLARSFFSIKLITLLRPRRRPMKKQIVISTVRQK